MRSDLVQSYGQDRLPRYTSYPTAPHFAAAIGESDYRTWLRSLSSRQPASIYLHVPFCRSMCWYCGCHTSVSRRDERIAAYAAALCSEIELVRQCTGGAKRVDHIHFGGGTPSILGPRLFNDLIRRVRRSFSVSANAEIAIELDPRVLGQPMVEALAEWGVTRASFGVQSFDGAVQRAINRVQTFEETAAAAEAVRASGVAKLNFDLIYGLPNQSMASCLETVRLCLTLQPDRFSVFGYAHVPAFKRHQQKTSAGSLPDGLERYRQFEAITEALQHAGYHRVGLDHFCLQGDSLAEAKGRGNLHRNFQGYTDDQAEILLGLGASAIGMFPQGYVQNETGIRAYASRIAGGRLATVKGYTLTQDDRMRADIIEQIMCNFEVDLSQTCQRHGSTPETIVASSGRLSDLLSRGIVALDGMRLSIATDARFLVRSVAAAFDAHLERSTMRHSRAV